MIFVAFLLPLALYLLALGWVNRQPRPMLVSGTVDFIGILFAASGFLLLGGPAAISALNERARMFWLLADTGSPAEGVLDHSRQLWLLLSVSYFVIVVAGCALGFWRRRGTTCVYNAEPAVVEASLVEACERLKLEPIRSGSTFVFVAEQDVVLEVEAFAAMKHVTLHWQPAHPPVRKVVEAELDRRLEAAGAPYHDTGAWLGMVGSGLLVLAMAVLFALLLRGLLWR